MEKTPEDFTRNADAALYGRQSTLTPEGVVKHKRSLLEITRDLALTGMAVAVCLNVMYPSPEGENRLGHQVSDDALCTALQEDAHSDATTALDKLLNQRMSPIDRIAIRAQVENARYHTEEIDFDGLPSMSSIPVNADLDNPVTPTPPPNY